MSPAEGAEISILRRDAAATQRLLPKRARRLGREPDTDADLCEFEVVAGNAAYQQGERFYLTRAQARNAYGTAN
ncbi:MAG TPA: hypothetical protein VK446_01940 [Methylocystis sp.]|nr:hypothetical protein [Methylocystis sp.]